VIGLVCIVLLVFVPSAWAFDGRSGNNVIIAADEVVEDDLYVGAEQFILNGTIKGDLIVAGGTIEINGTVEGDLMAAGQNLIINGTVMDDVRLAGMVATLGEAAQVGDDMLAVGYSLEAKPGSLVEQNLFFSGAQALLAGEIGRDASIFANGLTLLGQIGGDVKAEVGAPEDMPPFSPTMFAPGAPALPSVAGGLTVGEAARIGGDFDYTTRRSVTIPAGAVLGKVSERLAPVDQVAVPVQPDVLSAAWFGNHLRRLVALFLVGLLLVWLVPAWLGRTAEVVQTKPLPSLGWGLVTLFSTIVTFLLIIAVTVLLAIILGGFTLDNLMGTVIMVGIFTVIALAVLFGLTVTYVTKITVSYMGGHLLLTRLAPKAAASRIWPLVTGLVLFIVLTAIPFIGGWINFAVVLLGLGALCLIWQNAYRRHQLAETASPSQKPAIHAA
jgi:hypothetical protein